MALKTGSINLPEIPTSWTDLAAANAGENNTVNSLYLSHRNEPLRHSLNVENASVDLRVGHKLHSSGNGVNMIMRELGDDFQINIFTDRDYPFSLANRTQVLNGSAEVNIQLQKVINGNIVTGDAFYISGISILPTVIEAFEVYTGMILLVYSSTGGDYFYTQTLSYDPVTLALTQLGTHFAPGGNNTSVYGMSAVKVVDGRILVATNSQNTNTSNTYIHVLKVTAVTGAITAVLNYSSSIGTMNFASMSSSVYINNRNLARIKNDVSGGLYTFVLVGFNSSNALGWLTFTYNTTNDAITTLQNNLSSTTYVPSADSSGTYRHFYVVGTYSTANDVRFTIVYNGNSNQLRAITFNSTTATTAVTSSTLTTATTVDSSGTAVNNSGNPFTLYPINTYPVFRINYANKTIYIVSSKDTGTTGGNLPKLVSMSWNDTDNNTTLTFSLMSRFSAGNDINQTFAFCLFNNTIYIASLSLPGFARMGIDGSFKELVKLYNGTPIINSKKIQWSSFHNCYIVLVWDCFHYIAANGTYLGFECVGSTAYIPCFDVNNNTGEVVFAVPSSSSSVTHTFAFSAQYALQLFTPQIRNAPLGGFTTVIGVNSAFTYANSNNNPYVMQDVIFLPGSTLVLMTLVMSGYAGTYYFVWNTAQGSSTSAIYPTINGSGTFSLGAPNSAPSTSGTPQKLNYYNNRLFRNPNSATNLTTACYYTTQFSTPAGPNNLIDIGSVQRSGTSITTSSVVGGSIGAASNNPLSFEGSSFQFLQGDQTTGILIGANSYYVNIGGRTDYALYAAINTLRKVSVIRGSSIAVVVEEYTTQKIVRFFDERTGPLAVEIVANRQILAETYTAPINLAGGYVAADNASEFISYTYNRKYTLRNPGAVKASFRLSVLRSDGITRVPVLYDYTLSPGETFALPNWNPIYLASGDRLQVQASKFWQYGLNGMQLIKANI